MTRSRWTHTQESGLSLLVKTDPPTFAGVRKYLARVEQSESMLDQVEDIFDLFRVRVSSDVNGDIPLDDLPYADALDIANKAAEMLAPKASTSGEPTERTADEAGIE